MSLMTSPDRFFNREVSWLEFNRRVLEEAMNPSHPLLERLRFLSISASNLDEFYMVRYAGLREQMRAGITRKSQDGLTPAQQVRKIETLGGELIADQQQSWKSLKQDLADNGIFVVGPDDLSKSDRKWLQAHFEDRIFPILTPLSVDPSLPFPFLPNKGFAMGLALISKATGDQLTGIVPMPATSKRFIRLPDKKAGTLRFIPLEKVIGLHLDMLFPGFQERGRCLFRIIRDSDIEIEEEAEDLIREFEILLRQRRRGRIVRIKLEKTAPKSLRNHITTQIEAEVQDVVPVTGIIGLAQLSELIVDERSDLQFPPYEPRYPERIRELGGDCFVAIAQKDILVHHPYESFDVVVEFIRQAARDPAVVAIKQTLYRTTTDSPVVAALIEAAELGKNVTALVEIKARFDEETNLRLARDLERAGVQVVYGFIEYKTHAKVSLVVREEEGTLRTYTHFGTGNYHPLTARVYTDLSLFTADPALGRDAGRLFNYITANREPPEHLPEFETISMSPYGIQTQLLDLIDQEIANAKAGKPSGIWAKMNSLVDGVLIDALYRASRAGVPITLVVRGICCLRPGVKGLSETIRVKSIVGRFLEHSRIVCFANGEELTSRKAKVFMSSADWMPRNMRRRVEALVPLKNDTVHRQVLSQIMVANLNDDMQSWELSADGDYARVTPPAGTPGFTAHNYFMDNPSLSGRGSALELAPPPRLKPRRGNKARPA